MEMSNFVRMKAAYQDAQRTKFLTLKEAAELSTLSLKSIYNHRDSGKLKSYKVGGRVLIKESDLYDFIENYFEA